MSDPYTLGLDSLMGRTMMDYRMVFLKPSPYSILRLSGIDMGPSVRTHDRYGEALEGSRVLYTRHTAGSREAARDRRKTRGGGPTTRQ